MDDATFQRFSLFLLLVGMFFVTVTGTTDIALVLLISGIIFGIIGFGMKAKAIFD